MQQSGNILLAGKRHIMSKWQVAAWCLLGILGVQALPAQAQDVTLASNTASAIQTATLSEPSKAWQQHPLQIVISLANQNLNLYRGERLINSSVVSTGKPGHSTPAGIYSILQKRRRHYSNLYNNAPMPYMQRLTWSGIALHEGKIPGYPASHGCVRLPRSFARELFGMTDIGGNVVITRGLSKPKQIAHPELFDAAPTPRFASLMLQSNYTGQVYSSRVSPMMASAFDLEMEQQQAEMLKRGSGQPLRILITRRSKRDEIAQAQRLLAILGFSIGSADGRAGYQTLQAVRKFRKSQGLPVSGRVDATLLSALYAAAGEIEAYGHLHVRQGFRDLLNGPVILHEAKAPLGTHVFTALHFEPDRHGQRVPVAWTALTVDDAASKAGRPLQAREALDRVLVPAALRKQIEALIQPGTTLIISDIGKSRETGLNTDFIVQPR